MKKAICIVSSKEYFNQTKHSIISAKKHNPDYEIILVSDGVESDLVNYNISIEDLEIDRNTLNFTTNNFAWLVTARPAIIRYTLFNLNFDFCIFIDGDTYTYNSYLGLENLLIDGHSIVVTPHLLSPLPEDNKFPNMGSISLSGNYNSGVIGVSKKGLEFVNWWETQTKNIYITDLNRGYIAEQGWLRFAADFDDNTKIVKDWDEKFEESIMKTV